MDFLSTVYERTIILHKTKSPKSNEKPKPKLRQLTFCHHGVSWPHDLINGMGPRDKLSNFHPDMVG